MRERATATHSLTLHGTIAPGFEAVLTPAALAFLADLEDRFGERRRRLMGARYERQRDFDSGALPDFLPETKSIRDGDWTVAAIPEDLRRRRVEITGPVDRKMMINALNSGADVFMTDFEDANAPTWNNLINGQINLMDYARGSLEYTDPRTGKEYSLNETDTAVLIVRPRGLHMEEAHVLAGARRLSASFLDFGLHIFHNAKALVGRGSGPYFYLPKLESHHEAALWADIFRYAESMLDLPLGTIKATVLIETLPAGFEMDEILFALRDYIVGLNCGRWDYIFSYIKRLGKNPDFLLPDRGEVVMDKAFLRAYSRLLIKTCHKRKAYAMGGMAAQIPIKGDDAANDAAFAEVRADKEREAGDGHDGTWVSHPALVPVAMEVFDRMMPGNNQLYKALADLEITQADLLQAHDGDRTEDGLRENLRVGIQYIEAWLQGRGAVPLYNRMEDAATAEISRTQIWQWIYHGADLKDGRTVTAELVDACLEDEMTTLREALGNEAFDGGRFDDAIRIFRDMLTLDDCPEFLTTPAYETILAGPVAEAAE